MTELPADEGKQAEKLEKKLRRSGSAPEISKGQMTELLKHPLLVGLVDPVLGSSHTWIIEVPYGHLERFADQIAVTDPLVAAFIKKSGAGISIPLKGGTKVKDYYVKEVLDFIEVRRRLAELNR